VVVMALDPRSAPVVRDVTAQAGSDAALGQRLYSQVCQSCHGPDGNMIANHKLGGLRARQNLAATIQYVKSPKAPMPKMFPDLLDEKSVTAVATWIHEELK
jgi:alcohol dehydrogenase (cytochrome c)